MRLSETLVYTDISQLSRIASHYQLDVNRSSKNELIQTILQNLLNRQLLRERIACLSEAERRFLVMLLLDQRQGYLYEDLLAKAGHAARCAGAAPAGSASPEALIATLLNHGWIFPDKRGREILYLMPVDVRKQLLSSFKSLFHPPEERLTPSFQAAGSPPAICLDMFAFLRYVQDHLVFLTTEGVIHKRQQQQIYRLLSVGEEPVDGKSWRFGYGRRFHNYPDRFSFIYDFCYQKGWIEEREGELALTASGQEALARNRLPGYGEIFQFWMELYKKPIRNLPFLVSLAALYCESWIPAETLKAEMLPHIRPFYFDRPEDIFAKRILAPLFWLEWLARDESGERLRLTPRAKELPLHG